MNRTHDIPAAVPAQNALRSIRGAKISVVWLVPIVALAVGTYLVVVRLQAVGPEITVTFQNGDGLQPNETSVRYRGVQVGIVHAVRLAEDGQRVEVEARLDKSAARLAREGSLFWIVRPELSAGGLRGLQTIVSGSYIEVQPGNGKTETKFTGSDEAPLTESLAHGLELVLTTPHVGTLNAGAPIYHRGVEVGSVESLALNDEATGVNIHARIQQRYAALVREDSVFWNAGGLDVTLKFFGLNISAESVRSLVVGGIAFATPSPAGPPASEKTVFALHDKPDEKWMKWETPIAGWAGPGGPPTSHLPKSGLQPVGTLSTNGAR